MSPAKIDVSFAVLLAALLPQATGDPAKPCTPDVCKLPDCFCSGTNIPGNLSASTIPQIVMITFDAAINTGFSLYEELFDGRFKTQINATSPRRFLCRTNTVITAWFKSCTANATKSLTTQFTVNYPRAGGQTPQKKNISRR